MLKGFEAGKSNIFQKKSVNQPKQGYQDRKKSVIKIQNE